MSGTETHWAGWRGVCLVAVTYVYFLIFAQFAFLQRLTDLGLAGEHLKAVMGTMALGGIVFSLLAPRSKLCVSPGTRLRTALFVCGAAALLTLTALNLPGAIVVAVLIGSGLGLLTVTLVTHLRLWLGSGDSLFKVALGTGLGYLICNLPVLFTASPSVQAIAAALLCLVAIFLPMRGTVYAEEMIAPVQPSLSFPRVLACFTALVWLDSAAFFIIQNTPVLKAGTWQGSLHLWSNGLLHLIGALASAWLLRRRGVHFVLAGAFLALAAACLLLLHPERAVLASLFYPVGVSLYSVALVAFPSLLAGASSERERGIQAGWIYAVAGWSGSAMGIGMGQHLGHVPIAFVLVAGLVLLAPGLVTIAQRRRRECIATAAVVGAAFCIQKATAHAGETASRGTTAVARGRQVYIAEGCINCHSQYVRPNTSDELLWGPTQTIEELHRERPPLIGNRRQGPDLSEVGARRSPLWLRAHLLHPMEVSHASFMPSYAYLFGKDGDQRGENLIAYLTSLRGDGQTAHQAREKRWQPAAAAVVFAKEEDGARLFAAYCSTCHDANGATRRRWAASFQRMPPDLTVGPILHVSMSVSEAERRLQLARLIKFGIAGTDMPGHEYLPDPEVAALSMWLDRAMPRPSVSAKNSSTISTHSTIGEQP
jgi:cbb3-type cytochrome c oxidase subunit II